MVKEDVKLTEEQQKMLKSFLKAMMMDSRAISFKSDRSRYPEYEEIVGRMDEVQLHCLREDWSETTDGWEVTLEFLYPLRELIE